jgi:hypothetical protein
MSDGNRSPPIAVYRHQAVSFDGKSDGKFGALSVEVLLFQVFIGAGDDRVGVTSASRLILPRFAVGA